MSAHIMTENMQKKWPSERDTNNYLRICFLKRSITCKFYEYYFPWPIRGWRLHWLPFEFAWWFVEENYLEAAFPSLPVAPGPTVGIWLGSKIRPVMQEGYQMFFVIIRPFFPSWWLLPSIFFNRVVPSNVSEMWTNMITDCFKVLQVSGLRYCSEPCQTICSTTDITGFCFSTF